MNSFDYEYYHEKKSHVNEHFPYNTYLCTIPLDFTQVNAHWHKEVELIIIKKGKGKIVVDLQPYIVSSGEMILVLPGQLHAIYQLDDYCMEYENILFLPHLLYGQSHDLCTSDYMRPFFENTFLIPTYIHREFTDYTQLSNCIHSIDDLCAHPSFGYELGVKGYLFQFFFLLFSKHIDSNSKQLRNRQAIKLKEILFYISTHYTEPLTPGILAKEVNFSASHFMKFFKHHMGCTFTEYLNDYRLSIAATQLSSTNKPILELCEETGFTNLSYFNRLFKKKYGMPPRAYRNSITSS